MAAVRCGREEITALRRACERSRKVLAAGRRFAHRTDLDFHRALLDAARSPRITEQVWREGEGPRRFARRGPSLCGLHGGGFRRRAFRQAAW
ncbi:FCD domain-containing protein [Streptomyces sp. enrichment culture]|uniref:FCD domain-containing protein n=1 Tax=Streptomyces sp. enrichment culture TaxID=1795815 RepID=UPI003F57F0E4